MKLVNKILTATYAVALITLGFLLSSEAKADTQYSLVGHIGSQHGSTPDNYRFNQVNLGVGLRASFDDELSVQIGTYRNSYYRQTAYLALNYMPIKYGDFKAGAFVAVVTGYGKQHVGGGLIASYQITKNVALEATFIPKAGKDTTHAVGTQINVSWN
jgi:hypothetical protein